MSVCKPKLIVLYKSQYSGHRADIRFNFKFANNAKFPQIRKQDKRNAARDLIARKKSAKFAQTQGKLHGHIMKNLTTMFERRIAGIDTETYVTIDPYKYVRGYDEIRKLPQSDGMRKFREEMNDARRFSNENLEYFLKRKYDILLHSGGEIEKFLNANPEITKTHNVIMVYSYNSKPAAGEKIVDIGRTHNISRILKTCSDVCIYYDKKPVLTIEKNIVVLRNDALIKKMDEGSRIMRHIKSEQIVGGGASISLYWIAIAVVVLLILLILLIIRSRTAIRRQLGQQPQGQQLGQQPQVDCL